MDICSVLQGGDPRSLGKTEEVVSAVLRDRTKLDELFNCIFNEDEVVRMRACDGLEKICQVQPDWVEPYTNRILDEVVKIEQPSVRWHVVQMIGELELDKKHKQKALTILKSNLETATDWIVLNYTLQVFMQFAKDDASLVTYFIGQLTKHSHSQHKSVAKRAQKLLEDLKRDS